MDPVEQFLADLASKLPRHKRQNVLVELRSNLRDRVAELTGEDVDPATAAAQAVAELGDPNELAAEYGGGRIIIPATRYHLFKGGAAALVAIHLVATVIATIMEIDITLLILRVPNLRGWPLHEVIWVLGTQALADLGLVALLFWWADLTLPRQFTGWAVRTRTAEAKPHWSGLIAPLAVLGLLNVWRNEVLALYATNAEGWYGVPLLDQSFVQAYLWPVNVVLLLALGVHTYKIISGPTAPAAGAELVYRLAVFALIGALLGVRQPFDLPGEQLDALGLFLTAMFKLTLLGALFASAFNLYRAGARLVDRLR